MNSPAFSRLASHIRNSHVPAELKNKLLLLFYRLTPREQVRVLNTIESNTESLPIFAEFTTELEQNNIRDTETQKIEELLEKYLAKLDKIKTA